MTTLDPDLPAAARPRPAPPPAPAQDLTPQDLVAEVRRHTRLALAQVARRVALALAAPLAQEDASVHHALAALHQLADELAEGLGHPALQLPPYHPLARLDALAPSPAQAALWRDLLLLSCLPLLHEGFGALCRLLHPQAQPRPTPALALCWLEAEAEAPGREPNRQPFALRDQLEDLLCPATRSPLTALGLLHLQGDGPDDSGAGLAASNGLAAGATPWHTRSLLPGPGVWEALMARAPRLPHAALVAGQSGVPGLEDWLDSSSARQAIHALRRQWPCQLLVLGGDAAMRATRVRALLGAAHAAALRVDLASAGLASAAATRGAALLNQSALWLESRDDGGDDGPDTGGWPAADLPQAIIASARSERQVPALGLPLLRLDVQPLSAKARRTLWQALLPANGTAPPSPDLATLLAARYPIEPDDARAVVRDLGLRQALSPEHAGPLALEQVSDCIRARTPWSARPGVQRVAPRAGWDDLLLPDKPRRQLQSAVRRVSQQITVLDDWGFAQGRAERRGVRLLFFGLPGTGKTLAAEVMARELGVDLLVVDLASLVSKWIGETEKNLAAVFDMAERSRALLLFDEADALFARRTETQDAHDRYANLETAYLLQRLERYESLAVLTTNLRANLDPAFARRFEFIVEFPEPDAAAREQLWRLHLPAAAPLGTDVDLPELAAWYALSGAQVKNAALSAAFLAAAQGQSIHQRHFLLAIEREFDKAGRAHPGFPPHAPWPPDDAPP